MNNMGVRILSRRIHLAPNFARVEVLVGHFMQDAEWLPLTQFMSYDICKEYVDMLERLEQK